jgi:uncharacterized membrane protein YvlD (DUF360 family)
MSDDAAAYGESAAWHPAVPRLRLLAMLLRWLIGAVALLVTAALLPGMEIEGFFGALVVALFLGLINAILPPLIAGLRLPATVILGFLLVLVVDAIAIKLASDIAENAIHVDSFWTALVAALVVAAVTIVLEILFGANDDEEFTIKVVLRVARRQGEIARTDVPGIVFLEIDGLAYPVLQRAMRDGSAPELAKWLHEGSHRLVEWETDLSSQTGSAQAGILLGSNGDIPAFRWVEKADRRLLAVSGPDEVVEVEARHSTGSGLLREGGASRGNIFSGEADEAILTVARLGGEKKANPGYRAFLANGFNVTRTLVLVFWEVILEWSAALRERRRDILPRGHRGGRYPFMRAVMCVFVRDLIVYGVLQDMMRGRPVMYATFSSYDEVAHHSGLERADTLEALRKVDQQFGRISRARRFAPRPYEIVVLSDHGQTQGATFKQRNGYSLAELVERSVEAGVHALLGGDENDAKVAQAYGEARGKPPEEAAEGAKRKWRGKAKKEKELGEVVVLGSGNLGLVYLMQTPRRMTLEEIEEAHPRLVPALREHPHVGWLLVHSSEHGAVALGARGAHYLADGRVEGEDPLALFSPTAPALLRRTDGFSNVADIMVGSFYEPELDEGCAFEELISFHGGLGGSQTRPFILYPARFELPDEPIVGAEHVHRVLDGWRWSLHGGASAESA